MTENNQTAIIGQNIKHLRESQGFTQEALAQYLGIARELVSYYESGSRSIPSAQLGKLADLFCINEFDFYESDPAKRKMNIAFAFRASSLESKDLESIAQFKKIVRNYMNMKEQLKDD